MMVLKMCFFNFGMMNSGSIWFIFGVCTSRPRRDRFFFFLARLAPLESTIRTKTTSTGGTSSHGQKPTLMRRKLQHTPRQAIPRSPIMNPESLYNLLVKVARGVFQFGVLKQPHSVSSNLIDGRIFRIVTATPPPATQLATSTRHRVTKLWGDDNFFRGELAVKLRWCTYYPLVL